MQSDFNLSSSYSLFHFLKMLSINSMEVPLQERNAVIFLQIRASRALLDFLELLFHPISKLYTIERVASYF